MSLFFMKNKYEIDNEILKKTTHCQNNFSCLEGYLPKICVYVPGIERICNRIYQGRRQKGAGFLWERQTTG